MERGFEYGYPVMEEEDDFGCITAAEPAVAAELVALVEQAVLAELVALAELAALAELIAQHQLALHHMLHRRERYLLIVDHIYNKTLIYLPILDYILVQILSESQL